MALTRIFFCCVYFLFPTHVMAEVDSTNVTTVKEDMLDLPLEDLMNIGVYTASKKLQRVSEAPANAIVITEEEIRNRGYSNLKDVLADLPGMETIEYSYSEYGTMVPVRGVVGNNKIILLVNGIRVNPPGGEDNIFRHDQSVRYAKRIEVVYGPGSALYGADAVSAVINIVTIGAKDRPKLGNVTGRGGNLGVVEASTGLWAPIQENSGLVAFAQGYSSNGTNYMTEYGDYYKPLLDKWTSAAPPEGAFSRKGWGKNAFLNLVTKDSAFQYWHRSSERSSAQASNPTLLYSDRAKWIDKSDVLSFQNNVEVSSHLNLKTTLSYNKYELDPTTSYVFISGGAYNYADQKYARGRGMEMEEQVSWQISPEVFLTGGISVTDVEVVPKGTVNGGFQDTQDLVPQSGSFTYYPTDADRLAGTNGTTVKKLSEFSYSTIGAYLQTEWHVFENLKAVAGARIDKHSRFAETPFNPRATLIYSLSKELNLKYIFAKAYVAPPPYYTHNIFANSVQLNISNTDLRPEKATTHEINATYQTRNLVLNLGAYYNLQEDLFLPGISSGAAGSPGYIGPVYTTSSTPVSLTKTVNAGVSKFYGIDSMTKYRLWGNSWMFGVISYMDGEVEIAGTSYRPDRISNVNVRLGASFELFDKFVVSPRISWRSDPLRKSKTYSGDDRYAYYEDAYFRELYQLDLYASYRWFESAEVFLNLTNVTNHKYTMRGSRDLATAPAELFGVTAGGKYSF